MSGKKWGEIVEKSLLELLEKEKTEVLNLRFYKASVSEFISYSSSEEKDYNKDSYYRLVSTYEEKVKESEEKLVKIRKELKQYFSFLMKIE